MTRLIYILKTSMISLRANIGRSLLTVLGIVIGVTAIIIVMAVGRSAENVIVGELGGLGAETVVVRPGREPKGPSDFAETLFSDSLKDRDFKALLRKQNVPDLIDASPGVIVSGSISYKGETFTPLILGFSAKFMLHSLNLRLSEGVAYDEKDIRNKIKVVLIGQKVRNELFGEENPVGRFVRIKGQKFRVSGVFEPRGQVVFFDVDELVLTPYTTAQAYLAGFDHYNEIITKAASADKVSRMVRDIKATLRELHNIEDTEKDDFYVQTQQGLVAQVRTIIGMFTLFLSLVVAIALLVGGIGVMNIMLVSVTERTREIGLRKALGATNKNILTQFLFEAIILTLAGGIIGIVLGAALALGATIAIARFSGFITQFSFPVIGALLGVGVSFLVGVAFGIYPARKASRMSPLEALRYE